jgi:hypothetical protein
MNSGRPRIDSDGGSSDELALRVLIAGVICANRGRGFVSFIATISMGGVALALRC